MIELCTLLPQNNPTGGAVEENVMPSVQDDATAGWIGDTLYLFGGFNALSVRVNNLVAYTPATGVWVNKAVGPPARNAHGLAVINNELYVYGGNGPAGALKDLWKYNPVQDVWTPLVNSPKTFTSGGVAGLGNFLYAAFGLEDDGWSRGLLRYDIIKNTWVGLAAQPGVAVQYPALVAIDNRLYLSGGYSSAGSVRGLWIYDISSNTWLTGASLPLGRYTHVAVSFNSKLYIHGGVVGNNQYSDVLSCYNPATNSWTSVKTNVGLSGHFMSVVGEKVYLGGGRNEGGRNSKIWDITAFM